MFYFPSTIAWLDDDPLFIQALSSTFEDKHPLKIFHTPQDCIKFFENYTAPLEKIPFLQGRTQDEDEEESIKPFIDAVKAREKFLSLALVKKLGSLRVISGLRIFALAKHCRVENYIIGM